MLLTPGIECHTHEYIRTGHLDSKFGFDPWTRCLALLVSNLPCCGGCTPILSQILNANRIRISGVMVEWLDKATRYGLAVTELNVGGGLGIQYTEFDDP